MYLCAAGFVAFLLLKFTRELQFYISESIQTRTEKKKTRYFVIEKKRVSEEEIITIISKSMINC